jgi:hypothetical protein
MIMNHGTATTPTTPAGVPLAQRAITAARAYRATDPDGFDRRHDDPATWSRWVRRARVTRDIAAALQIPPGQVTVTDDPARRYRTRTRDVPGDLITVTDPDTSRAWRFLPDITAPGQSWLLIDNCPECDADVPVTRIATLADLGDYLDPECATKALLFTDGGERPHSCAVVAAEESWRQPDPVVAGKGGSSLDKVASVQNCRMGRAR